jgi:hypothetical protein
MATSGKVTILNLALESKSVAYTIALPENTTQLALQPRGNASVSIYFSPGGDGAHYFTVKTGGCYYDQNIRANQTITAQATIDSEVLEIIAWSDPS